MKAVQLQATGIEHLAFVEVPAPEPAANEVLVQVEAASLNSLDVQMAKGIYPARAPFPYIPVTDGAGVVAAIGSRVTRWKAGDRVTTHFFQEWTDGPIGREVFDRRTGIDTQGMLASYVCVPEHALVRTPANVSSQEAATLPIAGLTAWYALVELARLQAGQTVLVQGTGGVSLFALQIARMMGARVIALSGADEKLQRLRELGADATINYHHYREWQHEVMRLTGNAGADVILDIAGGSTLQKSIQSVKRHGFIGLVGYLDNNAAQVDVISAIVAAVRLQGISVGSRAAFERLMQAVAVNGLHPVIDKVFPLEAVQEAYRYVESGRHFGKVVITVGE